MAQQAPSMEPLSARLPTDLYLWLAQLQVDGATTNSDKLRVLLAQLKRQHDGAFDYVAAYAWARDLSSRLREALVRLEGGSGAHSDVLDHLIENITALVALVVSAAPADKAAAATLEENLVRRAFTLSEGLLRQATTPDASALDPGVVRRHMPATIALAAAIQSQKGTRDG